MFSPLGLRTFQKSIQRKLKYTKIYETIILLNPYILINWSAHGDCIHLSCIFTLPGKERQTFANFSHNFHPNLT